MKKTLLTLALLAGWAASAHAAVAVSSVSVAGVPLIAASSSAGQATRIKSLLVCNDKSVATCVLIQDAGQNKKLNVCVAANTCWPNSMYESSSNGWITGFFGEVFDSTTTFTVSGATPAASGTGGISVQASYIYQPLR